MTRAEQIAALADGTRSRDEVRQELGMSWSCFRDHAARAKKAGMAPSFRPSRLGVEPLWLRVANLLEQEPGLTGPQIAKRLNAPKGSISSAVRQARQNGREVYLPDVVRFGDDVVTALPPEVKAWLDAQVPKGSSRVELIRAIIIDAYHEEVGQ